MTGLSFDIHITLETFDLNVSHHIPMQGITALFGHSGSGKSTLLRILAGLEQGAEGRISFGKEIWQNGSGATSLPSYRRGVGYVFQDARLFPHLDVAGNLAFAEKRSRHCQSEIDMASVMTALDLAPLVRRRVPTLSGGERQRVALARALLTRPKLLLLDEPLSALDSKRKREILPLIEHLPALFGIPVIYVTHAVGEVARVANHMVVLSKGKKVADGPVEDVLARLDLHPATGRFEAGVVLRAKVRGHDAEYRLTYLDHHGQTLTVPRAEVEIGREVRLRVRARDVVLATERPQAVSVRNVLEGSLVEIVAEPETAFAETLIDVGGGLLRARITRQAAAELDLTPGASVFALIKSVSLDRSAHVSQTTSSNIGEEPMPL